MIEKVQAAGFSKMDYFGKHDEWPGCVLLNGDFFLPKISIDFWDLQATAFRLKLRLINL